MCGSIGSFCRHNQPSFRFPAAGNHKQ
uniref:Uncharacterized protein n=1 Tax=Anguilla anguilla TaxID=7936 RepID=A0A0E9VXP8_ANGAN